MPTRDKALATILVVVLVGIAALSLGQPRVTADEVPVPETVRDGLFVHVSSLDAHRALMGLKMAAIMADDRDVLVYLDVEAAVLGAKGQVANHPAFDRSNVLIGRILEKGGIVCVCPTCLEVAGYEAGDLRDGVKLADEDELFSFTRGRILSIDY